MPKKQSKIPEPTVLEKLAMVPGYVEDLRRALGSAALPPEAEHVLVTLQRIAIAAEVEIEDRVPREELVRVLDEYGHAAAARTILDDIDAVCRDWPDPDETLSTIEVGDWLRKHGRAVPSYDRAGVIEALDEIDWKTGKTMGGWDR